MRPLLAVLLLAAFADAQTIDIGQMKPPEAGKLNNTVSLTVRVEQGGAPGAVTVRATGTAKLPDGCSVQGYLKHKVNDSPLSPTQGDVRGGSFSLEFGPYASVYPGLYEVEVVFFPERASGEVQQTLARELGEAKWRAPSSAKTTIAFGDEKDPRRQTAEFEAASFAAISTLAVRLDEMDKRFALAHREGGLSDGAWLDAARTDIAKAADEAEKAGSLFGNPFTSPLEQRLFLARKMSLWLEAEAAFFSKGTLPEGVDPNRRERVVVAFANMRAESFGSLDTAKASAWLADLRKEDVRRDVAAVQAARAELKKALALERKGPSNASRLRGAVQAAREAIAHAGARNLDARNRYAARAGLSDAEKGFAKCREDLAKALTDAEGSLARYEATIGRWELSDADQGAESEIDGALAAIDSRLK